MKPSTFPVMTMDQIEEVALKLNCEIVVAKPNELQFDLDTPEAFNTFQHFFYTKLEPRFGDGKLTLTGWKSKSGHDHTVVGLPSDFSVEARIAMQAAGGSDFGREFAALCCHFDGSPHPILLFRPKEKK